MNNRLVKKKKRKIIKLDDRFFNTSILIIDKLSNVGDGGLGVNDIIKQTSSDRTYIINLIRVLVKAGLVIKINSGAGVVNPVKLTALGNEIGELMSELVLVRGSFKKYEDVWQQWFFSKERSKADIKLSISLDSAYAFVKSICEKDILLALIHRYSLIHYKYELDRIAEAILINIVTTELKYQLLEKGKQVQENDPNAKVINEIHQSFLLGSIMEPIINDIQNVYTKDFYISSWETGKQQLKDFLSSLLTVAKISNDLAGKAITFAEYGDSNELETVENKTHDQDYSEHLEYVGEILREFRPHGYHDLPKYKEYRKKDREELISIYKNL